MPGVTLCDLGRAMDGDAEAWAKIQAALGQDAAFDERGADANDKQQ
ncbi:MAG: hypothetical protein LCH53_13675 [Bacteroidetes bacterium]|nr:hypothetical protein [Bacteroidota bacterium]